VSGNISCDTVWDVDKVNVIGDILVEDGVCLTIVPGVLVEFQDYYRLSVSGRLLAEGSPDDMIRFTTDEPGGFTPDSSHDACWNGLRFENTAETNKTSRLAFCVIEYSKATLDDDGACATDPYPFGGGAISVYNFSKLVIENCIIRHNVAKNGGAIFLYYHASPDIVNNLIYSNHALENGSALYCAYSYPRIINNTIVHNTIHNQLNPYLDSCAVLLFLAKPLFSNNIIRSNDPEVWYFHRQLLENKEYYTHFNNIEDYPNPGDNIDADPLFLNPDQHDYHLCAQSPCIDAGDSWVSPLSEIDMDGDPRFFSADGTGAYPVTTSPRDFIVDIGADEYCLLKKKKAQL